MSMRTLVAHVGGIGDCLLACPAVAHLAREGPVELVGQASRLRLAVDTGLATAAHDMDAVDFGTVFSEPSPRLWAFLERFDRAVIWMRDTAVIEERLRDSGIAHVASFPGLPPEHWRQHASEYYLACLGAPPAPPLRLQFPRSGVMPGVVIHPGSGSRRKNWPRDRYLEAAEALSKSGRRVTWCLGPAEEDFAVPPGAEVWIEESLSDLGAALANADLYVGNDSGITHLAASAGCPTVAIFGPTEPEVWAPRGSWVRTLRGTPWPSCATVLEVCHELLAG
jgi:ADP-heptose:LPS heptosyltransferase